MPASYPCQASCSLTQKDSTVGILPGWALVSLLSAVISWRVARRRRLPAGAFAWMALLLGPGAIPLAQKARPCPQLAQSLAVAALLGGLSTTLFLLSQSVFLKYADHLTCLSLALPIPTYTVLELIGALKSGAVAAFWVVASILLPLPVFEFVQHQFRCEDLEEDELAIRLLGNWAKLLPVLAVVSGFLSVLAFALLEPVRQLSGWVGG